jgi:hypothetical protein
MSARSETQRECNPDQSGNEQRRVKPEAAEADVPSISKSAGDNENHENRPESEFARTLEYGVPGVIVQ